MSVSTFLHLEDLEHAKQNLANYENQLRQLVSMDIEKTKADIKSVVSHFTGEVARIRGLIDSRVLSHLDEGAAPPTAVKLAELGAPTQAETAARILAEQQATAAKP